MSSESLTGETRLASGKSAIRWRQFAIVLAFAVAWAVPGWAALARPAVVQLSNTAIVPAGSDVDVGGAGGIVPVAEIWTGRDLDLVGVPIFIRRSRDASGSAAMFPQAAIAMGPPLASRVVTSGFGVRRHPITGQSRFHSGVDIAAPYGAPVFAPADGRVEMANWAGGYGLAVMLDHGAGLETRFGHLSRVAVRSGQTVRKGQVIGYVGSTGNSTGPHLHYETRINGAAVNPAATGARVRH